MEINNINLAQAVVVATAEQGTARVKQEKQTASATRSTSSVSANSNDKNNVDLDHQKVKDAVTKANDITKNYFNNNLNFSIDDKTKRLVVKVVNSESGEVVRQIPPEDMLKFIEHFDKIRALLFSAKY